MTPYNKEQSEAIFMVKDHLAALSESEKDRLKSECREYLLFREDVGEFLDENFSSICTKKCYDNRLSACCSKEGIITFFSDVVINILYSEEHEIIKLLEAVENGNRGFKCVYLSESGCLWRIKPIVCEMFLCDQSQSEVFDDKTFAREKWEHFRKLEKKFKWPDRPVLFDYLESYFIKAGFKSSLMYFHNSPGLMRIKKLAGLEI